MEVGRAISMTRSVQTMPMRSEGDIWFVVEIAMKYNEWWNVMPMSTEPHWLHLVNGSQTNLIFPGMSKMMNVLR
jgi:hypothetical protein